MPLFLAEAPAPERVFLVVVDGSPEQRAALHWACLRARHTNGRIAMFYVIQPIDTQQWLAIEDLMREERRSEAEEILARLSDEVQEWAGSTPVLYMREGLARDELLKLLDEEPSISILVLGASTGADGPGPLVSHLAGNIAGRLRVPIAVIPGGLTDEQLFGIA
jgi:nucleotide-binding universal stress UspA family protein